MSYSNVIKLKTDRLKLDLLPELGGRVNKLVFNEFDIFLPFQTQVIKPLQSYKGGSFSLVPFSNRIKNSRFNFNQLEYNLIKNDPPNAIHGHAYLEKWNVLKKTDSSAVIVYKHLANKFGWPWSYEVFQTITLEDNNIFFEDPFQIYSSISRDHLSSSLELYDSMLVSLKKSPLLAEAYFKLGEIKYRILQ